MRARFEEYFARALTYSHTNFKTVSPSLSPRLRGTPFHGSTRSPIAAAATRPPTSSTEQMRAGRNVAPNRPMREHTRHSYLYRLLGDIQTCRYCSIKRAWRARAERDSSTMTTRQARVRPDTDPARREKEQQRGKSNTTRTSISAHSPTHLDRKVRHELGGRHRRSELHVVIEKQGIHLDSQKRSNGQL